VRLSLRARLLLLTAGLLLTGLAVSGTVVLDQLQRYQLSRTDTQLRSFATIMSQVTPESRPSGRRAPAPGRTSSTPRSTCSARPTSCSSARTGSW
jgi:hypothetical protein